MVALHGSRKTKPSLHACSLNTLPEPSGGVSNWQDDLDNCVVFTENVMMLLLELLFKAQHLSLTCCVGTALLQWALRIQSTSRC